MSFGNIAGTLEVDGGEKQLSSACLYEMLTFAYSVLFLIPTTPKCYRDVASL